jgi:hypothetical protein
MDSPLQLVNESSEFLVLRINPPDYIVISIGQQGELSRATFVFLIFTP